MSRHVVGAFTGVNKRRAFRAQLVGGRFHVDTHIGIRVFVNRKPRRCVLDENMQHPDRDFVDLRAGGQDLSSDQVKPARFGS